MPDTRLLGSGLGNALTGNFLPCLAPADMNFLFQEVVACVIAFAPASYLPSPPAFHSSVGNDGNQYRWASAGARVLFPLLLCSLACGLWYESELFLQVFIFCYFASRLVSKTTFRTSHQTPCSLERNWPLPFQCVNNCSHSFFIS